MRVPPESPEHTTAVVGRAIQDMAAARLGRGFIPLALVFLLGLGALLTGGRGLLLPLGAPVAAAAMLAYGLAVVRRAFGHPRRLWMTLASVAGVWPPLFGLYLTGWRGLKEIAGWGGMRAVVAGVVFTVLGLWVLRAWMKILELGRLADTMVQFEGKEMGR